MSVELADQEILRLLAGGVMPEDIADASRRIVRNAIRCNQCGGVAESTHRHDMTWCRCRSVAADGGHAYLRRAYIDGAAWEDLTEYQVLTDAEIRDVIDGLLADCPAIANPPEFTPTAAADFRTVLETMLARMRGGKAGMLAEASRPRSTEGADHG